MKTEHGINRIGYLDSARGIAALMVMFYHYTGWKYGDRTVIRLSHLIINGSDAVTFFFVLSGFVLSYPYLYHRKPLDIGKFYVSRIFRIYPAFLVALLINVFYSIKYELLAEPFKALKAVFLANQNKFWEEAYLINGSTNYLTLDWTLSLEMVMSFFMPFVMAIAMQNRRLMIWLSIVTFFISYMFGIFFLPFVLGVLVCVYYDNIKSKNFENTKWFRYRGMIVIAAILLFSIRHIDRLSPLGPSYKYIASFFRIDFFTYTSIASFIFLVFIIHSKKVQRFLEHRILIYMGKISYGIYLMHWVVVTAIFEYWDKIEIYFPNAATTFLVMMIVCAGITILLATMLYKYIELPFIKIGKRITTRMKPTLVIELDKKD